MLHYAKTRMSVIYSYLYRAENFFPPFKCILVIFHRLSTHLPTEMIGKAVAAERAAATVAAVTTAATTEHITTATKVVIKITLVTFLQYQILLNFFWSCCSQLVSLPSILV